MPRNSHYRLRCFCRYVLAPSSLLPVIFGRETGANGCELCLMFRLTAGRCGVSRLLEEPELNEEEHSYCTENL